MEFKSFNLFLLIRSPHRQRHTLPSIYQHLVSNRSFEEKSANLSNFVTLKPYLAEAKLREDKYEYISLDFADSAGGAYRHGCGVEVFSLEQSVSSLKAVPHLVWLGLIGVELLCGIALVVAALHKPLAFLIQSGRPASRQRCCSLRHSTFLRVKLTRSRRLLAGRRRACWVHSLWPRWPEPVITSVKEDI